MDKKVTVDYNTLHYIAIHYMTLHRIAELGFQSSKPAFKKRMPKIGCSCLRALDSGEILCHAVLD